MSVYDDFARLERRLRLIRWLSLAAVAFSTLGLVARTCERTPRAAPPAAEQVQVEVGVPSSHVGAAPAQPTDREVAPVRLNLDPRDKRLTCPPGARAVWTVSVLGYAPPPPRCFAEPAP